LSSDTFTRIQRAVKIACAHTKKQEYKNEGDDSMTAILDQYITKEAREAAEARGEARGEARAFNIVSEVISSLKANVPVSEIASKYKIAIQEVEKLRTAL